MKLTITEDDINKITGRFIIQVNTDEPVFLNEIQKDHLPFYLNKRVNFVSTGSGNKILLCDLYGGSLDYTRKKFVDMFNNYLGDSKGERYHRLLTQREMDIVSEFMKSRQY